MAGLASWVRNLTQKTRILISGLVCLQTRNSDALFLEQSLTSTVSISGCALDLEEQVLVWHHGVSCSEKWKEKVTGLARQNANTVRITSRPH